MSRVVEIAGNDRHLKLHRGFMVVETHGQELGRIPLDDLSVVLVHGFGVTYSNNLMVELAGRTISVIICDASMNPAALMWPVVSHHRQAERMEAQARASLPLKKRVWQTLVRAKIRNQGRVLRLLDKEHSAVSVLESKVTSGDASNTEAVAARIYWPLLMGPGFKRGREEGGLNNLLNYGYMVLRAATARAVMAAGLNPSFPVHHKNLNNPMRLVDDFMEPFRPVVDMLVHGLAHAGVQEVDRQSKAVLAAVADVDMDADDETSPVFSRLAAVANGFVQVLLGQRKALPSLGEVLPVDVAAMLERGRS